MDVPSTAGTHDGPISPDAWKRAIYRRAPSNFDIRLLPPEKQGSSYSYGFRISPINDNNARATSSGDSFVSLCEYEIWRKWEDCLHFQDTLEVEYARAAREKRARLASGKGVKKNGVYIHSDHAASWESLPFGPSPADVARDIHDYIPKLSKKGTLFRASQETINNRFEDLQRMMSALLQEDLPTLVKEIKETRTFTDFFGIWRRDVDLARKAESSKKLTADHLRPSLSTSVLSLPSSPSTVSLSIKSPSQGKGKVPERPQVPIRASTLSDSSSSEDSVDPQRPSRSVDRRQEDYSMRSRASSSGSHSSSSLPSTPIAAPRQLPPTSRQPAIASPDVPIRFGHNPHLGGERASSYLEALPEDRELSSSPKPNMEGGCRRKRSGSTASRMHRNASIYVPSSTGSLHSSDSPTESSPSPSSYRYSRVSMQSTHSSATLRAAAYLDELDVDYCLPSPTPESRMPRASISSLASVMTNASVDAVIPRSERPSRPSRNNMQRPFSQPEEPWREYEQWEDQPEDQGDILDAYFYDLIGPEPPTPNGYPETPNSMYHFPEKQSSTTVSSYSRYSDRRSSLATSVSSGSTTSSGSSAMMLSIKAMHEENIVMLRVSRYVTFDELRRKIYEKFMQSAKATICETFAVALLEQPPSERPRAASLTSVGSGQSKGATLHFISSQDEWDDVVATHSGKIFLRIIGSRE